MGRRTQLTSLRQISEINLTPLMDLTFILLITFIITFPLIEQGVPVNLPKGKARELSSESSETITIGAEGAIYFNNQPFTLPELAERINKVATIDPDLTIMVRADEKVDYGQVVKVMQILHGAGIVKIALITQVDER